MKAELRQIRYRGCALYHADPELVAVADRCYTATIAQAVAFRLCPDSVSFYDDPAYQAATQALACVEAEWERGRDRHLDQYDVPSVTYCYPTQPEIEAARRAALADTTRQLSFWKG